MSYKLMRWLCLLPLLPLSAFGQQVVINEIMYHAAPGVPESHALEWIEFFNRSATPVNLNGWKLSRGVDFTFPNITLSSGAYLVVCADLSEFQSRYPGVTNAIGNWVGVLSNNGETLQLDDASGQEHDEVRYASEGDWAVRRRGRNDLGFRGWDWYAEHDGLGKSLELINSALSNDYGQNWAPSVPVNGTPGRINSVATNDVAPLIIGARHFPAIPRSTETVTVSAAIIDEQGTGVTATVFYRDVSTTTPLGFSSLAMFDDGAHGDAAANDGIFGASLQARGNNAVVEFYIRASDGSGRTRTWPAPAIPAADLAGPSGQVVNALYQVDDSTFTGPIQPFYRIIMTESERAELDSLGSSGGTADSDAQMNGTFISSDPSGVEVRYNCGFRNRGHGSRTRRPNNIRANFANDRRWKDVRAMNFNTDSTVIQVAGAALFQKAGLPMANSHVAQVRVNNTPGLGGSPPNGFYAANEELSQEFVENHFPDDTDGDCYRGIRVETTPSTPADFTYLGPTKDSCLTSPNCYRNLYFKQNNGSEDDWTSLIEVCQAMTSTPVDEYVEQIGQFVDIDNWLLYFACNTLGDNNETSLSNGSGDDYAMYRGMRDRRMKLMGYDVDSVFSYQGSSTTRELFRMTANQPQINRFITHPDVIGRYYGTLKRLIETSLSANSVSAVLDRSVGPYVAPVILTNILNWVVGRNAYVLSQIPTNLTISAPSLTVVSGYPRTVTSTVNLSGQANVIETRSVRVNGQAATFNPRSVASTWSATVSLQPGINRLVVQAFNIAGQEINRATIDIWYDDASVQLIDTDVTSPTTWIAANGPYVVSTNIAVAAGTTLTIQPGTTIYFEAGASLIVRGRLVADGADAGRIRFTRAPGATPLINSWAGLIFDNAAETNSITAADFEYAGSATASIAATNSTLVLNGCTFGGTSRSLIDSENSSIQVRGCTFPSLSGSELPRDLIRGRQIPSGGFFVIENSLFGSSSGQNDIIKFRGGQRPGPILQVINNRFTGASDDAIELSGADAFIEGNTFVNVHQSVPGGDVAAAVAAGDFGPDASEVTLARNAFYDCDYAALAKNGGALLVVNNTVVHSTVAAFKLNEAVPATTPAAAVTIDGTIIWDTPSNFENLSGATALAVNRSILVAADFPQGVGVGNMMTDPRLTRASGVTFQTATNDFRLLPGSPAMGTGPNGLDIGAIVRSGASISGEPPATNNLANVTLTVGGPGITHYRYRVNFGAFSATEYPISAPLQLTNLANGNYLVQVIGKNDAGAWQPANQATVSRSWRRDGAFRTVLINEVLARNVSAVPHGETYPDMIELYNGGANSISLAGMSITDDPQDKSKFVFPARDLAPGEYLILFADDPDGSPGLHTSFGLDADGDGVFLFDASGNLLDSVRFGIQLPDLSIGRLANGSWGLAQPTFGAANRAQPVGSSRNLRINEWLAAGGTLFPEDFIELYSLDPAPVALGGLYLSDAPQGAPTRHAIAPLSFIAQNGFAAFQADSDPELGSNHLSFRLSADGGQVSLFDPVAGIVDCIYYRTQQPDTSEGRMPSGASTFAFFGPSSSSQPTPGAPNPAAVGFSIVQTTNSLLPMLSTWRYERSNTDLGTAWRDPSYDDSGWLSGTAPLGWETCAGFTCVPFGINTPFSGFNQSQITYYFRTTFTVNTNLDGFTITLTTVLDDGAVLYLNGAELMRIRMPSTPIDHFTLPDAPTIDNASLETFTMPVSRLQPGTNYLAVEVHNRSNPTSSDLDWGMSLEGLKIETNFLANSVLLNEAMANNTSVTNGVGTNPVDWVELFNPFATNASIAGMSLTDDLTQPRRWVFPPGASIPARGYLVVTFNGDAPATTNGNGPFNTGFGLDADGDRVYLFDTLARGGVLLDSVIFGIQPEDFTIGRYPNATGGWVLNVPTPGSANLPQTLGSQSELRLNEWLANPTGGNDDWFEIYNGHPLPVALGGLFLTDFPPDATQYSIPPLSFIAGQGFVQFQADNAPARGANHVNFRLSAAGEWIVIYAPGDVVIDQVRFENQDRGVSEGRFPDGNPGTNFVRFPGTATPGASNLLPLDSIMVNEVLTHTDPPLQDAIELHNISAASVDVSGWYITDNKNDPRRFRIPTPTVIEAGGLAVFYESDFNPDGFGRPPQFSLSGDKGDQVYVFPADANGRLLGYRSGVDFGAAENGVSFGQYLASIGYQFTLLSSNTFGQSNAYPKVGPIVISEIMYHPPPIGTNDNTLDEFIELQNITAAQVSLFDPGFPTNTWRLRDAVDFDFPRDTQLRAGGRLLVVGFNPATNAAQLTGFKLRYGVAEDVQVLGPFEGRLSNDDENIELYKPDAPNPPGQPDAGFVPYVIVDQVHYRDSSPWAKGADGDTNGIGASLQRRAVSEYGNDPVNWLAGAPTAGAATGPAIATVPTIGSITASPLITSAGATQTLIVNASGTLPLQYEWRFNGALIQGANTNELMLSGIQVTNEGIYTVLINNAAGAVMGSVNLLVQQAPVILRQPQSRVAALGGSATFSVTALGSRPINYQWQRSGTNIPGATSITLRLTNIQQGDEATYRVIVSNAYGSVTSDPAALALSAAPAIVLPPQSTNVFVGASVTLSVLASGSPPLAYQWFKDNTPIAGATSNSLPLVNLQTNDTANYTVRVTNDVGLIVSSPATVVVTVPPRVTVTAPDGLASEPGSNTGAFTVSRTGGTSRPLTVSFTVGGTAGPGNDYSPISGPITLQPGSASTNILVVVLDDLLREGNETVTLTVNASPDYAVGAPAFATVTIIDDDNLPPSVTLTNPVDGATFNAPASILLAAAASDPDGSITSVEFFANGTNRVGVVTTAPYLFTWTNVAGGAYVLTAIATDELGAAIASDPVNITVNAAPIANITNPQNGASFNAPVSVPVIVTATDADGTVARVDVFAGTNLVGSDFTAPYSILFTNNVPGTYALTARAVDERGATGVSAVVTITVNPPVISFVDNFAARGLLTGYTNFVVGTNTSYTKEAGEPRHAGTGGAHSGWLSWLAPASGVCTMHTLTNGLPILPNPFDTVLAIYTGNSLATLTNVTFNDDDSASGSLQSRLTFNATAGTVYHIAIDGYSSSDRGTFYFRMSLPNPFPFISTQPQSQEVNQGVNVTFTVAAGGNAPLRYQWQFNTANIDNATNSALVLNNVRGTNEGVYAVIVSNNSGSVTSALATLTVRLRPSFTTHPQPQVVSPGSNATFNVVVAGTPPFTYQWRFNGGLISAATNASLLIQNCHYTNGGLYSVSVNNSAGGALSQSAELIVRPRIMGQALTAPNVLELTYDGTPTKPYALESSIDLSNWTALGTNASAAVRSQWYHTNSSPARIYRLRYAP